MMRALTAQEQAELSPGLWDALTRAGVEPQLCGRPHPAAYVVALWRGGLPIMAVGRTIWWPDLPDDLAGTIRVAVLQHELQHLLDYADRRLSVWTYLLNPRNWIYRYDLARQSNWDRLGAEQRASMAEALWRLERAGDRLDAARLRALIPWARDCPGAEPAARL